MARPTQKPTPHVTLPEKYNHEGITYESPLQEATLANVANQKNITDLEVNFLDLKAILSAEILDLEDQEKKYLQDVGRSKKEAYQKLFTKQKEYLNHVANDCLGIFLTPEDITDSALQETSIDDLYAYITRNKTRWDEKAKKENTSTYKDYFEIFHQLELTLTKAKKMLPAIMTNTSTKKISLVPETTNEQRAIFEEEFVVLKEETTKLAKRFGDNPNDAPLEELQKLVTLHEEVTKQQKKAFEESLPDTWKEARVIVQQASLTDSEEESVLVTDEKGTQHAITKDSFTQIQAYLYPFTEPDIPFEDIKTGIKKYLTAPEELTKTEQELILHYLSGLQGLFEDNHKVHAILDTFSEPIEKLTVGVTQQT